MASPEEYRLVVLREDAYPHEPDPVPNFNESMYFSLFDPGKGMGLWCRLGNRPNEGYAERTVCVYLPDGRVAFMAGRPRIRDNAAMHAGGLRFDIVEPFQEKRVHFEGKLCMLEDPREMADPSQAFKSNPHIEGRLDLVFRAASPPIGGRKVRRDGTEVQVDPEKTFGRAHFDQFMSGEGTVEVEGRRTELRGFGARDHTWGPRHWSAIDAYRWLHVQFDEKLALCGTLLYEDGALRVAGTALVDGKVVELGRTASLETDWDADLYPRAMRLRVETPAGPLELDGRVRSLIPLRNRRERDGQMLLTRITEAMTEFRCGDRTGLGMTEYLDQIVDGRPLGPDTPR